MKLPWGREVIQPRPVNKKVNKKKVNKKQLELEAAKEILSEIFHIRPTVVDDMIQKRLEDRCW